jgi:ribose transport system substrate-binding protein
VLGTRLKGIASLSAVRWLRACGIGVAALGAAVAVAACGGSSGSSGSTVGGSHSKASNAKNFVVVGFAQSLANPYGVEMLDGARAYAHHLGVPFKEEVFNNSSQTQDAELQSVLAGLSPNQHALVMIIPNADADMRTIAEDVTRAHSYVTTFDQVDPNLNPWNVSDNWVAAVGFSSVQEGSGSGKALFDSMGKSGGYVEIDGAPGTGPAYGKRNGLHQAQKAYPNIKLLSDVYGDWTTPTAYTKMKTLIAEYGNKIKGAWGANDASTLGILQALKDAHMNNVKVVSASDAIPDALKAIKNGKIIQTYSQIPYYSGAYAIALDYYAATGQINVGKLPHNRREFMLKLDKVNKSNVNSFIAPPNWSSIDAQLTPDKMFKLDIGFLNAKVQAP